MPLGTLDDYMDAAAAAHGHMCAGQILGIRMAIYGLNLLGLDDPTGEHRKRLVAIVEIDRCATDAIAVVTGCRLGKRSLKFMDFGKVAATFYDLERDCGVRVTALESSRQRAREMFPELPDPRQQQKRAYRELADTDLFSSEWVRVRFAPEDLPGYRAPRVICAECGESVNQRREVELGGRVLCRSCAGQRYWEPLG